MKIEVNKDKLTRAINKAEKIATKNSTLPALSCLLFHFDGNVLYVHATNLDISVKIAIKTKGSGVGRVLVPATILNSFLSNLPKNDSLVRLEVDGTVLHVTSDSTDTTIHTQPVDDFPIINDDRTDKKFTIYSKDLLQGFASVWYSTATSSIKPELSSVYIYTDDGDLVFVGTDSFRLAESRIITKNLDTFENVLIPYKNVSEIIRIFDDAEQDISIFFNEDKITFDSDDTTVISRIIDGVFPDYRQIIPKDIKTEVQVLKEDLQQALRVSNVFTDKFNQIIFTVLPQDGIFQVNSNSNDAGETKNNIKSKITGDSLKISFNGKYIMDCFGSIRSDGVVLKFNGTEKPVVIQGTSNKDFLYLVMPMNK